MESATEFATVLSKSIAWDAYRAAMKGKSYASFDVSLGGWNVPLPTFESMVPVLRDVWFQVAKAVHDETVKQIMARYNLVPKPDPNEVRDSEELDDGA